jgi:hypothetical protein
MAYDCISEHDGRANWEKMNLGLYEVRPRKDHRSVDLISAALPLGRLWNAATNAIGYTK